MKKQKQSLGLAYYIQEIRPFYMRVLIMIICLGLDIDMYLLLAYYLTFWVSRGIKDQTVIMSFIGTYCY